MEGFSGFPDGKLALVLIPDQFFGELLPIIDDLFELKVILHCLWLIQQKQGDVRYITTSELMGDEILMRSLQDADLSAEQALTEGLERAVARGTLLQITAQHADGSDEKWYLVNGERGRAAVGKIERGEWTPTGPAEPVFLQARRPNIFNLYEQNIGMLSPLVAEELKDAEQEYPPDWITDAFRVAVSNNVRRWAYVRGILERWAREGRGKRRDDKEARRRYADYDK
jgi:DnaD/phage-associated family protein